MVGSHEVSEPIRAQRWQHGVVSGRLPLSLRPVAINVGTYGLPAAHHRVRPHLDVVQVPGVDRGGADADENLAPVELL